jgi:tripartite-type tricarboxylate transporter receptor subunit TctC
MFVAFIVAIFLTGCTLKGVTPDAPADFPTQPINIIVGFSSGGGSDQWVRSIASAAERTLGTPV